jgi:hypothetical protein
MSDIFYGKKVCKFLAETKKDLAQSRTNINQSNAIALQIKFRKKFCQLANVTFNNIF